MRWETLAGTGKNRDVVIVAILFDNGPQLGDPRAKRYLAFASRWRRHSMKMRDFLEVKNGIVEFRPCGETSLVEAVELITQAITYCPVERIEKRPVVTTGLTGVSIPTLVDRFLMVEDWAREAKGTLAAAM